MTEEFIEKLKTKVDKKQWVDEVVSGVETIIESGRITSDDAIADLRQCLDLLQAEQPTPFQWDTSIYLNAVQSSDQINHEAKLPTRIESQDPEVDMMENLQDENPVPEGESADVPQLGYLAHYLVRYEV